MTDYVQDRTSIPAKDRNAQFLDMLPHIRRAVTYGLRKAPWHAREEDLSECIANAYCAFTSLVRRDKTELAYPTALAQFALKQLRDCRKVGNRRSAQDVMSPFAQRRHGFEVTSLVPGPGDDMWEELVLEDKHAGPSEIAVLRLDFRAWLRQLEPMKRDVAKFLARGEGTSEAAERFGLSQSRISQLRRELETSWLLFQSEQPALVAA